MEWLLHSRLGETTSTDKVAIIIQSRLNEELCFYKQHRWDRVPAAQQNTDTKTETDLAETKTHYFRGYNKNPVLSNKCVMYWNNKT